MVAPDLPCDDPAAGLDEYADSVVDAIDAIAYQRPLVIVAQSYGGFTAPLVADRMRADVIVLVAGMIPAPGSHPPTGGRTRVINRRCASRPSETAG